MTVVVAGGEYPERSDTGSPIDGHRGRRGDRRARLPRRHGAAAASALVTNGGRILGVTGVGDDLERRARTAYEAARAISFAGARYRRDIALCAEGHVRG